MEFFDDPITPINLTESPREPWFHTAYFFSRATHNVSVRSANWVQNSFEHKDRLRDILDFLSTEFEEGVSGRIDSLERVWFFPWTESARELRYAFANALAGLHRACVDHQRRALELVIVGAYFIADDVDEKAGSGWLKSEVNTPMFTRAMKVLMKDDLCVKLDIATGWSAKTNKHYWELCDTVHVRGYDHSLNNIQDSRTNLAGLVIPSFSPKALQRSLSQLIETAELMHLALALANPILLFGVPLEEKYGLNGPIGFYTDGQAHALRELLPAAIAQSFIDLAERDSRVESLRRHFDSLPDLSPETLQRQLDDL